MKSMVTLLSFLFSISAFADCMNLTGDYRTPFMTYYSIRQDGCSRLDINDETGTQHIELDNLERKIDEYDVYTSEDEVLANVQVFSQNSVTSDKWISRQKSIITFSNNEQVVEEIKAEAFFNKGGNLETRTYYPDGSFDTSIDLKY